MARQTMNTIIFTHFKHINIKKKTLLSYMSTVIKYLINTKYNILTFLAF